MKRFSLIMLSQTGSKKVIYDYNTCEYMQHIESASKGTGYTWLLFQPFTVFGLELFGQWLLAYPARVRMILGIVAFLIGAAISAISWEAFLSHYGKRIITESRKMPEPTDTVLRQWASDFPRRIRNANRLMAIISFVTIIIIAVFIVTGVPLALTFALCVFCVGYFIWASARSGLLKRFMKERINNG